MSNHKSDKNYSYGTETVIKLDTQSELELRNSKLYEAIQTLLDVYENIEESDLKNKVYITLDKITTGDMDFISISEMREKWKN